MGGQRDRVGRRGGIAGDPEARERVREGGSSGRIGRLAWTVAVVGLGIAAFGTPGAARADGPVARAPGAAALDVSVPVGGPAPRGAAAGPEGHPVETYRTPWWRIHDSMDWWSFSLFEVTAPLAPDLVDREWYPERQWGVALGLGTRLTFGPLLLDMGWELSSPLWLERFSGELESLPDHGSTGFVRVGEHIGVGLVSPPLPTDQRTRLSFHVELATGLGINPIYATMLEVYARPALVFTLFGRRPEAGSTSGGAFVLSVGRHYSKVPHPSSIVRLPEESHDGPFASVGFRALWGTRYRLPQPKLPPPKPKPAPRPVVPVVVDRDDDGVADAEDECPQDPEDRDGFADHDGCPEWDNDGDGVPDTGDVCPNEAETFNSYYDADGCPDEVPRQLVEFVGVIPGIQFEVDSDRLLAASLPVLDQAAQVLLAFPNVQVQIQGHSSAEGDRLHNIELSWLRAEAVRKYLISRSVPPGRLRAKGFGPDKPVAGNDTEADRARNRRVEFKVVKTWEEAE